MSQPNPSPNSETVQQIPFKAETRQLLEILIHSLYTNREIFLRELISNASDALIRLDFEMLTKHDILDPDAELAIRILPNKEEGTLTIQDSGVGMTRAEMDENLGTIAHSGARAFIEAARSQNRSLTDVIGQFGVGFYSAFMAAEWIRVESHSYQPESEPAAWTSSGADTYTIEPSEMKERGTRVILKLKEDAKEFLEPYRLREIVRHHSDFIPFPIYIGEEQEQANRQTALWRQQPRQVEAKEYDEFYKQFTLDPEPPRAHTHMVVDAPVQLYALLFVPAGGERNMFSPRHEDGLKLYARKVLIQDYCKDLLPEAFRFIQGVIDSEDLPLNVSRESVQNNRLMTQLKKLVTGEVIKTLKKLADEKPEEYIKFWETHGIHIKEGVATDAADFDNLASLLRYRTNLKTAEWSSLDDYIQRMPEGQDKIYYILGEDERSVLYSPHLDAIRKQNYEVLLFTDPVDSFVLLRLTQYKDKPLANVATAELPNVEEEPQTGSETPALSESQVNDLIERFKQVLGEKVSDVRKTERLSDSPARLVDPEGTLNPEMQRVYRMLNRDFSAPKKVLEINPRHPILTGVEALEPDHPLAHAVIEQVYEDALLVEGIHPEPASMISRIQKLMEAALKK